MKKFSDLMEGKVKILKVKLYYDPKDHDTLYTATDNKGRFILTNNGAVYFSDKKNFDISELNKPHCRNHEYDVMLFQGKLGIYDSNMNLIQGFKNFKDLINNIDEVLEYEDIELLNWEI